MMECPAAHPKNSIASPLCAKVACSSSAEESLLLRRLRLVLEQICAVPVCRVILADAAQATMRPDVAK